MAITPYLYYEDVGRALRFLAKAFGFRKYGVQMRGPDGKINHAAMKLGEDLIMMGRPPSGYRNPKRLGQATQSLYINVKGVDKHFQRARKAGALILRSPPIRSTAIGVMGRRIPRDMSGISRRTFAVRNRSGWPAKTDNVRANTPLEQTAEKRGDPPWR
jgi:uncharacterized glyoxalase superfamily protein PhnB